VSVSVFKANTIGKITVLNSDLMKSQVVLNSPSDEANWALNLDMLMMGDLELLIPLLSSDLVHHHGTYPGQSV